MISTHLEYFIFILLALWKAKLVSKTSEIINILPHNKYFAMKIPMLSSFLIYFLPRSVIYHLKCIWLFGICNTIPPIFSLELSVMFYGRIEMFGKATLECTKCEHLMKTQDKKQDIAAETTIDK